MERDFDTNPYDESEDRVAKFLCEAGLGGGDDPIGFMLASHAYIIAENKRMIDGLTMAQEGVAQMKQHVLELREILIEGGLLRS